MGAIVCGVGALLLVLLYIGLRFYLAQTRKAARLTKKRKKQKDEQQQGKAAGESDQGGSAGGDRRSKPVAGECLSGALSSHQGLLLLDAIPWIGAPMLSGVSRS